MVKLDFSNIITCFHAATIGTKVVSRGKFLLVLAEAIGSFDWSTCRVPGQAFIQLPKEANPLVSGGMGKKTVNPDDYVVRVHRGEVHMFLKRQHALPVDSVAVVVYTKDAYLDDPDVKGDVEKGIPRDENEYNRIAMSDCEYILVAVLASSGPVGPVSPGRFVANLAGGNNEYALKSADELRAMAVEIRDFHREYSTVAD